ncbi:MAG TPA: hypothetical protein VF466_05380 [Candidatus Saccharimonadales bacterium]
MLDKKLQLKEGQTITLVARPASFTAPLSEAPASSDALLVFAAKEADLLGQLSTLQAAAKSGKLTWVAYPKAKQLQTDLNRDIIRDIANQNGLDPVRQIALDDTWSALRLKSLQ